MWSDHGFTPGVKTDGAGKKCGGEERACRVPLRNTYDRSLIMNNLNDTWRSLD